MIMCICLLGTLGTSWMGVVSVRFPGLGTTAGVGSNMLEILKKSIGAKRGQYVGNTQEISKNERFAYFNFFFTVRTPYFLKMIMCI